MKVTTKQRSSYIFRNAPQLSSLHRFFFLFSPIQLDYWSRINSKEFNLFMVRDAFIYKKRRFLIGENAHN